MDWTIILASFAAAASAVFAGCQFRADRKWRKLDRTFSHSPYRNVKFLDSIEKLKNKYECFRKRESDGVVLSAIPKQLVPDFVLVANLWGQMAMEYKAGLLDEDIAKKLLRTNFVKFCQIFENWLGSETRSDIYTDTLWLYDKWKSH